MRTISIRLDDTDYAMLNEMLASMGLKDPATTEIYTKTALRLRRIPFSIEAPLDPFYSESNQERLRHSFRQEQEGKLIRKTMAELEEMANDG